jgi:hypothetical protein
MIEFEEDVERSSLNCVKKETKCLWQKKKSDLTNDSQVDWRSSAGRALKGQDSRNTQGGPLAALDLTLFLIRKQIAMAGFANAHAMNREL